MAEYKGISDYEHSTPSRIGVLVTNLGTPTAPTTSALRRYLAEFLSDRRVIEMPRFIWWCILHGIILRVRPRKSAAMYARIWTEQGSPLLNISNNITAAIRSRLANESVEVALGMRYGEPSIRHALEQLQQAGVQQLLVLPLYPQYSATTTASTFDALSAELQTWRWLPELRMIRSYHDDTHYITALTESIRQHWNKHGKPEKLLFSFHGIPKSYFVAGDPYYCQCHATARLVAEQLALPDSDWLLAFQSRFGPQEWLQPYTDKQLITWAEAGIKHVQVICPGFAADCLETLEEINIQNRKFYQQAGGETFSYIPALNEQPLHIETLCKLINQHTQGWSSTNSSPLEGEPVARLNTQGRSP
ncbi:MAG: ferrochelatase [Gammaproteobacteria bacterium]